MTSRKSVDEVMGLFAESAHQKGLELACLLDNDIPIALQGDPWRLRQILANLVGNAVKFTERGEVFLHVTVLEKEEHYGRLCFKIRDTGIGIAQEAHEYIFKAFSQADGTTTRRYGGTGLGLAISKQLVEMMGGEIALVSAPNSGSTFSFTLPFKIGTLLVEPAMIHHADLRDGFALAAVENPQVFPGTQVLLAEDNPVNQEVARCMVESFGCRVDVTSNGQEALDALSKTPYDLVFMDCQMPELDGYAATRESSEKQRGRK